MKKLTLVLLFVLLSGCTYFYTTQNLNAVRMGMTKQALLEYFPFKSNASGMTIRAAQRKNGKLIEVGEVQLMDPTTERITSYWFLFADGRLQQWGRPEDWQKVDARLRISYSPPGIPPEDT